MRSSQRLLVALACAENDWPHEGWPAPDDPYVGRVVRVAPPYDTLHEGEPDVAARSRRRPSRGCWGRWAAGASR
ncbi:hypothetical protein [Streptomyces sp. NPDC048252]|uniref:hypothetical protein n=1 Tax=Streptomyces sp. NPDC048252 TaxID=3154612 RepID=UPI00342B2D4C